MLEELLSHLKRFIPRRIFLLFESPYHYTLAFLGALLYGFPSRKLFVIGVTGTKGKTTTVELINAVLEEAGYTTALAGTLRFKIGDESRDNLFKMTLPGRFFIQKFLAEAVEKGATHAVIEISSEAVKQYRHRFLSLDALVFTNLAPEHIESHGSYEKYVAAKLEIGKRVLRGGKKRRMLIVNADDKESERFEKLGIPEAYRYSLKDAGSYTLSPEATFSFEGETIRTSLIGAFNIYNALAALTLGKALGIKNAVMKEALETFRGVRGRSQLISTGQDFQVVVDYAHTPDSLEALYKAFEKSRKICVLSGTGGGRDRWKRPAMGKIASRWCDEIILTDEDPYDEDPAIIVNEIRSGIDNPRTEVEMDRRKAIARAIGKARRGDAVLITGKGTDPYIMGPGGAKTPWSDARVAEEELRAFLTKERS